MNLNEYIERINTRYRTGIAREHSYRADLQTLLETMLTGALVTNEPARVACGAPDYIITRGNIPVGYIEAKDLGTDLNSSAHKEQLDRYRLSLNNLVITDYLTFRLYREGNLVAEASIGQLAHNKVVATNTAFEAFNMLIAEFGTYTGQTIRTSAKLAKLMAGKARLLADIIAKALAASSNLSMVGEPTDNSLSDQYNSFKLILIHDITPAEFADIYAQTIAYGMFAARLHDPSLHDFSRQEAAELIPRSNPFLRKLFQYIAGYDLDDRIRWVVDALADVFRATDVAALLSDFEKGGHQNDPIIHFYETFLSEYDPKLRKARGVWYTPAPVVDFMVGALHHLLQTVFNLPQGLADTTKTNIQLTVQNKKIDQQVHRVQLLDPATGTGTFLAAVIKHIYKKFEAQQGMWSNYVESHLLPRLNGFELLMASYAMAHLKLDLLLKQTGYKPSKDQRFRVYLTNSLEEHHPDTGTLFANWLSSEANEANHIKRDTPVMCVLGNPPYSVSSSNKSPWIEKLTADYKKDLNERNIQPLSDDYIKFIRYGQYHIEKNGSGILAYISNNSFLDGIIHRKMRHQLLKAFDTIYILDLHGNAKKKEVCPDGTADQNVFDIMQGVSINLFVKSGKKKENANANVWHYDLFGKREEKYAFLNENALETIPWMALQPSEPNYFFVNKNFDGDKLYETGFKLDTVFLNFGAGVQTKRDLLFIDFDKDVLINRIEKLINNTFNNDEMNHYNITNSSSFNLIERSRKQKLNIDNIKVFNYRVFDNRVIYYDKDLLGRSFYSIMKHVLADNIGLIVSKQQSSFDFQHCFVTTWLTDHHSISMQTREESYVFPLYLYPESTTQQSVEAPKIRRPNLNMEIVAQIAAKLNCVFLEDDNICCDLAPGSKGAFSPLNLLNYIYAVLHSPVYRSKYKEFLKIDFPRIPYPKDLASFEALDELGHELIQLHLLQSPLLHTLITGYPIEGSNVVSKPHLHQGRVYINDAQYFEGVPTLAWEFYIGGYQPAQKWLKDRKGRSLTYDEILHYQKIIVALHHTHRLMQEIGKLIIE